MSTTTSRTRPVPVDAARATPDASAAGAIDDIPPAGIESRRDPRASPLLRRVGLRLLSALLVLLAWWGLSAVGTPDQTLRPSPGLVWHTLVDLSTMDHGGYNGMTWWQHLEVSLRRVLLGTVIGVSIGLVLGLAMGVITPLRIAVEPMLTFVRNLPPLAYFSLVVIWFGIDETPKIILLAIAAAPPVAVVTAGAVTGTPRALIEAGRSIGLGRTAVIRHVVIPSALPEVLTGIRLSVAIAYSSVVAAETINGLPGIGGMVRDAQAYNNTAVVVVGILAIGISGLLIDSAIAFIATRVTPWRGFA
jgi:taurine transport system permease protein